MEKEAAEGYNNYFEQDMDKKLTTIEQSVEEMLTRLEEFETLLSIVQQNRCNSLGLTGSLTQTCDKAAELKDLCKRVDQIRKLVDHIHGNIELTEQKVDEIEEQCGITDRAATLRNMLSPLFKSFATREGNETQNLPIFSTKDYFKTDEEGASTSNS